VAICTVSDGKGSAGGGTLEDRRKAGVGWGHPISFFCDVLEDESAYFHPRLATVGPLIELYGEGVSGTGGRSDASKCHPRASRYETLQVASL
jgi:hypothetical protein